MGCLFCDLLLLDVILWDRLVSGLKRRQRCKYRFLVDSVMVLSDLLHGSFLRLELVLDVFQLFSPQVNVLLVLPPVTNIHRP